MRRAGMVSLGIVYAVDESEAVAKAADSRASRLNREATFSFGLGTSA